jgi:hypothetical protein
MPENGNVATEAKRLVLMKFAQMKLEQANNLDAQLDQMRLRTAKQMEKLKVAVAAAPKSPLEQFEATVHQNEDIDAFIRVDKGGSADINQEHMENLGRTSIRIMIERIGQFQVQKPRMIYGPVNDQQKILNSYECYALSEEPFSGAK